MGLGKQAAHAESIAPLKESRSHEASLQPESLMLLICSTRGITVMRWAVAELYRRCGECTSMQLVLLRTSSPWWPLEYVADADVQLIQPCKHSAHRELASLKQNACSYGRPQRQRCTLLCLTQPMLLTPAIAEEGACLARTPERLRTISLYSLRVELT
jgi:hypothetical protein